MADVAHSAAFLTNPDPVAWEKGDPVQVSSSPKIAAM